MKKFCLFLFALTALFACNRQQPEATVEYEDLVLRAGFASTRTVLQDGGHVYWSPGEELGVFRIYNNSSEKVYGPPVRFVSTNTEPQASVEFYGKMPVEGRPGLASDRFNYDSEKFPFWAIYPYDEEAIFQGYRMYTTLPQEQKAVPGTFAKGLFMAAAYSSTTDLEFHHPLGGLKFSVVSEGITKVSLQATNGRCLAGPVRIDYELEATPEDYYNSDYSVIGLTPEDGGSFIPGESYYFVTLPVEMYTGFSLVFERSDGKSVTRTVEKSVEITAGDFRTLMEADKGLVWEDTAIEITPETMDVDEFDSVQTVFIKSVPEYQLSIDVDWIQEVEISGTTGGDARFEGCTHGFFVRANFGEARTGHINFTIGNDVHSVTVNQASGSYLPQIPRHHLGMISCTIDGGMSSSWKYSPFHTVMNEMAEGAFDYVAGFYGQNGSSQLLGGKELLWSYSGGIWGVVDGRVTINGGVGGPNADVIRECVAETDAYYTPLTSLGLNPVYDADTKKVTVTIDFYAAKAGTYKLTGLLIDNYVYCEVGLTSEGYDRVVTAILPDYKGEEIVFDEGNTVKQLQYVFDVPSEYSGGGGRWGILENYYVVFYTRASYDGHLRLGCAENDWYIDNSRRAAFGESLPVENQ